MVTKFPQNGGSTPTPCLDKAVHAEGGGGVRTLHTISPMVKRRERTTSPLLYQCLHNAEENCGHRTPAVSGPALFQKRDGNELCPPCRIEPASLGAVKIENMKQNAPKLPKDHTCWGAAEVEGCQLWAESSYLPHSAGKHIRLGDGENHRVWGCVGMIQEGQGVLNIIFCGDARDSWSLIRLAPPPSGRIVWTISPMQPHHRSCNICGENYLLGPNSLKLLYTSICLNNLHYPRQHSTTFHSLLHLPQTLGSHK